MFRLSSLWRRLRAQRALPLRPDRCAVSAEERPPGCGWFDSSHDLHQGLRVTEHAGPNAVAGDLALSDGLGLQLAV